MQIFDLILKPLDVGFGKSSYLLRLEAHAAAPLQGSCGQVGRRDLHFSAIYARAQTQLAQLGDRLHHERHRFSRLLYDFYHFLAVHSFHVSFVYLH